MKKLMLIALILISVLTACRSVPIILPTPPAATQTPSTGVSPAASETPMNSPSPSETADSTPSVSPGPSPTATTAVVPSVSPSPSQTFPVTNKMANSNYTVYEDQNNIYFLNKNEETQTNLFRIDKQTRSVKQISGKDCSCFTVNNGIVYYTELSKPDIGQWNVIKSYNPSADIKKTVIELKNNIYSMAAYNGKIYFSYNSKKSEEPYSDLYVMGLNGTNMKKVAKDVYTFCIDKNVVYYTESSHDDLAVIDKINIDGSGQKQLVEADDWYFDVSNDKLFYDTGNINLSTGEISKMGYNEYAPLVNCLIYDDYIASGNKETCHFHSYDLESGQTTDVTQIQDVDVNSTTNLHPTNDNVYYSVTNADGSFMLYRLVNVHGKASMELTATYTNNK